MHFGLLYVKPEVHGCQIDDGRHGKYSLSANTRYNDIFLHN